MMNDVVDAGSCCECGSCVLVCPHNVIEYIDSKPKQTAKAKADFDYCGISEGVGCDVCASVCPRLWPRENQPERATFRNEERTYRGHLRRLIAHFMGENQARRRDGATLRTAARPPRFWHGALEAGVNIDGAVVPPSGRTTRPRPSPKVATRTRKFERARAAVHYRRNSTLEK